MLTGMYGLVPHFVRALRAHLSHGTKVRGGRAGSAVGWTSAEVIPREGASVLVDVFPATEANASLYAGEAADRVTDAAYALHKQIGACVVPRRRQV
ncbi:hypothetical protein Slala02_29050 [Streptomyces lavendulae subsp. lavendulae]|nr:hypothetical protein Slala01_32340 [Streptomyces lavendulae subsp. lavendulae]GLX27085.1 hypothetical protein Slala02_29050 [Streptomyces lavendulae subsp. lavendulae]